MKSQFSMLSLFTTLLVVLFVRIEQKVTLSPFITHQNSFHGKKKKKLQDKVTQPKD